MIDGIKEILMQLYGVTDIAEAFFFCATVKYTIDFLKYLYNFMKGVWTT